MHAQRLQQGVWRQALIPVRVMQCSCALGQPDTYVRSYTWQAEPKLCALAETDKRARSMHPEHHKPSGCCKPAVQAQHENACQPLMMWESADDWPWCNAGVQLPA